MTKARADIRSVARAHTPTAINVLTGIMRSDNTPAAARIAAAQALLDRGWGKAPETIETDVKPDDVACLPPPCDSLKEITAPAAPKPQTEEAPRSEEGRSLPASHEETFAEWLRKWRAG